MSSLLLKNLAKDSIISLVPGLSDIIFDIAEILKVSPGQQLAQKGDVLNSIFIPMTDDLVMIFPDGKDRVLQKGRSLAISAAIEGTPIEYDVKSPSYNSVLAINIAKFKIFMKDKPEYLFYLHILNYSPSGRNFKNYLSDRNLNRDLIVTLISCLEPFESPHFVKQQNGGYIYFIDQGRVNCKSLSNRNNLIVDSTITTGSWFGGYSILPPYELFYDVTFGGMVKGWRLDCDLIREKLKDNFSLLEDLAYEPWLQIDRNEHDLNLDHLKTITDIELTKVSPETAFTDFGIRIKQNGFIKVENDLDAIPQVLCDYAALLERESHVESFKDMLIRFGGKLSPLRLASMFELFDVTAINLKADIDVLLKTRQHFAFFIGNRLFICVASNSKNLVCLDGMDSLVLIKKSNPSIKDIESFLVLNAARKISVGEGSAPFNVKEIVSDLIINEKAKVFKILLSSMPIFLLTALVPKFTEIILDEVLVTSDHDTFVMAISGMILSLIGVVFFTYFKSLFSLELSLSLDNKLTRFIYFQILKMKSSEVARLSVGGVLNRIDELEQVREFLSTESINILIGFLSIIIYSAILLNYSLQIVLVPLGLMILIVFTQLLFRGKIRAANSQLFDAGARMQTFISEVVSNVKTVKAFGAESVMANTWDHLLLFSLGRTNEIQRLNTILTTLVDFFTQLIQLSGIWMASVLLLEGKTNFTAGELFAVSLYLQRLVDPLMSMINFYFNYQAIKISYDKISDIVRGAQEENDFGHAVRLKGKVKFDRVSFRYSQDGPWVLRDLSFSIFPGQIVGIVGKSGSGKTTLASLISGAFGPTTGRVFYDDYERAFISTRARLSQIGTIEQNNQLFAGSILSNIAFSDDIPERDRLNSACDLSYSNEFISKFPQGLDNFLAEGGLGLSGGQKQRLCIARTIYSNPKIMLFDEATSALDSESEKAISDNLKKILNGKTSFIIAHRLSTIKNADIILVLDQGKIVQQGNHEQLMKVDGTYRDLFIEQAGQ